MFHHGLEYEEKARQYLTSEGYKILAQNVRFKFGEIDIVASHQGTLVFVEVRKRDETHGIRPEETLNPQKVMRLKRAINAYLGRHRGMETEMRIDLIGFRVSQFDATNERVELWHFKDFVRD